MSNFVDDMTDLDFPKFELNPFSGDPSRAVSAENWNKACQAMLDLRAAVIDGGGGGVLDFLQKFGLGPLLAAPDLGPGSFDHYNPWTAAGSTTGSSSCVVINSSALGATILGLVSTGRRGDLLFIEVGGDGHGFLTFAHMASSLGVDNIYCPDGADVQIPKGGTALLQCLNDTDHGWRFLAASTGNRNNTGKAADFTLGSSTNNWNPWATGPARGRRWRVTVPTAGATLTGIAGSPDGILFYNDGEIITVQNMGDGLNTATATLSLKNFSDSSSNGNKIITPGFVGVDNPTIVVPLYGVIQLMRDNQFDSNTGAWFLLGKW